MIAGSVCRPFVARAEPATTTTLNVTASGNPVTSVSPGTVVTLTASVETGSTPLTTGQVNFCDASSEYCTDIHLLATAALTSSGTAVFKFVPGPGSHSYKAQFVANKYGAASVSGTASLSVEPAPAPVYSDTTAIALGGSSGNSTLTATVEGFGGPAQPTGNVSFVDTSFGNTVLATEPLGAGTSGLGWLISQTPAFGQYPVAELTADFNGDGIPDLAVLWSGSGDLGPFSVTILFGKGDGTFTTGPTTQLTGIYSYPYMLAGDFKGNGKQDLAILTWNTNDISYVTVFPGNGNGTFGSPLTSVAFNQGVVGGDFIFGSMVAADFNGDGILDLAVVGDYVSSGGVTILLGKGDGTFAAAGSNLVPDLGLGLVATGDFNGDGIPDLVVANYFGGTTFTILLGKGNGTFTVTGAPITFSNSADEFPNSIVVGDFNNDGKLDFAAVDLENLLVLAGNGDGTFSPTEVPLSAPAETSSLTGGDFNNDGELDFAALDKYDDQIDIFLGAGNGTFNEIVTTPNVSQDFGSPLRIVAGDFNANGVPDLAMLTNNSTTASILLTVPTRTATATATGIAPVGAGTHNVEASYPGDSNYSPSVSSTVALTAALEPVVFSLASGTYTTVQTVTLSEAIPGATIYYAAGGPVSTNGFVPYAGPIALPYGGSESIEAYAAETGYLQSTYTSASYTLNFPQAPAPVISPPAGSYPGAQNTSISDSLAGAVIFFTTNGTFPNIGGNLYSSQIAVASSETVVATAIASGYSLSQPAAAQYFIDSAAGSFVYSAAGDGSPGYAGDGGPATVAAMNDAFTAAEDKAGNLYIADVNNNVVREVAAGTGIITTLAGNGTPGYSGDGGPATKAQLSNPVGLALDSAGNLYIADYANNVIREVAASTGTISTYVSGLGSPQGITVDGTGNLYVAEPSRNEVLKVAVATRSISTYAGTGQYGYSGDGGLATSATLDFPTALATDSVNNLYIADSGNNVIREVNAASQTISTVAGDGYGAGHFQGGYTGDGGPATKAELYDPYGVAVDRLGNIYIADMYNSVIREVTASSGTISTVAGNGVICADFSGDGGPATSAGLCLPNSVSVDPAGNFYIGDPVTNRIRVVTAPALPPTVAAAAPEFSVSAGAYGSPQSVSLTDSTPGAAIYVTFDGSTPTTLSNDYKGPIDVSGNVTVSAVAVAPGYLPSAPVSATYTITSPPTATIATIAGIGTYGFTQSGGSALSVDVGNLAGIAHDSAGDVYFADPANNVVWMLSAQSGDLSVVAGNGSYGYSGDNGPATSAELYGPQGIAVDSAGNLYIADSYNNVVRQVAAATGYISTYAGSRNSSNPANNGDGGPATDARLFSPQGLAVDSAGNLYIADSGDDSIRLVTASTGIITTVAGTGTYGSSGDGGPATKADLAVPIALAIDSNANLYIGTERDGRVREVASGSGIITTIAGNGDPEGSSGDGGPATSAEVNPLGLAVDSAGNVYISNPPGAVRQMAVGTGVITTVAGNGYVGYGGDGGSATLAELAYPQGIACDPAGNLYIADSDNYRVRQVNFSGPAVTPVFGLAAGTYAGTQNVTIYDGTPGATVYYTTDGTTPGSTSNVYSAPVAVTQSETLQAMAILNGRPQSGVATAAYTITAATPVISLPPGSYVGAQLATITDTTAGAVIYYTSDGVTVPSTSSTMYTGPVAVTASETIMAIAVASGFPNSPVATAAYTIRYQPALNWTTPAEITYGTELGPRQLDASSLVSGTFVYSPAAGSRLSAGTHTLTVTFTPSNPGAYTSAMKSVEIEVQKATLTVTAKDLDKVYGAPVPGLEYAITGFVYGQTEEQAVSGKPDLATKATKKSGVGSYPITVSAGELEAKDYGFRFIDAELTVTKAPLTFAADNASVEYGKPLPKLTWSVEGFENGDTAKVLGGSPVETTTAKQGSPPGTYPIVIRQGTLKAENYSFRFKDGELTITRP